MFLTFHLHIQGLAISDIFHGEGSVSQNMMKGDRGERRRDLALLSVKDDITLHTWERGVSQKMTKGDLGE